MTHVNPFVEFSDSVSLRLFLGTYMNSIKFLVFWIHYESCSLLFYDKKNRLLDQILSKFYCKRFYFQFIIITIVVLHSTASTSTHEILVSDNKAFTNGNFIVTKVIIHKLTVSQRMKYQNVLSGRCLASTI